MVYKELIISVFAAFFLRLLSGYFFISIIKDQFFNNYIKVVYYLALLSLIFHCMVFFSQSFLNIFYFIYENIVLKISLVEVASRPNIIIYTFNSSWLNDDIFRNAGFAWEPGAFGLFCCLALFFNLIANNFKFDKVNIILFLSAITTLSLATYASLVAIIFYYLLNNTKFYYSLFLLPIFIFFSLIIYNESEFLSGKLNKRLGDYSDEYSYGTFSDLDRRVSRLRTSELDLVYFFDSPIIGKGLYEKNAFIRNTNTLTSTLRRFGLVGFFIIFYGIFHTIHKIALNHNIQLKLHNKLLLLSLFMIMVLTQGIGNKIIFFILFLYGYRHYATGEKYID